jgi:hypothetical protein
MTPLPTPAELRFDADEQECQSCIHGDPVIKAFYLRSANNLRQFATLIEERASPAKDANQANLSRESRRILNDEPLASQMRHQSAVQGWQPIETAPCDDTFALAWSVRDGTYFILDFDHGSDPVYWRDLGFTHWMPLPDAPQPPQGEGND